MVDKKNNNPDYDARFDTQDDFLWDKKNIEGDQNEKQSLLKSVSQQLLSFKQSVVDSFQREKEQFQHLVTELRQKKRIDEKDII